MGPVMVTHWMEKVNPVGAFEDIHHHRVSIGRQLERCYFPDVHNDILDNAAP